MSTVKLPEFLHCLYEPKKCGDRGIRLHFAERLHGFLKPDGTVRVSKAIEYIDFADLLKEYALLKSTGYCCEFEMSANPWNLWVIDEYGGRHFIPGATIDFAETFLKTVEEVAKVVKPLLQRCEQKWEKQIATVEKLAKLGDYYIPIRPIECELKDLAIKVLKDVHYSGMLEWFRDLKKYAEEEYRKASQ